MTVSHGDVDAFVCARGFFQELLVRSPPFQALLMMEELDDALCAIDLILRDGTIGDVSNGLGIARAARNLLDECVVKPSASGHNRMGGQITRFSKRPLWHHGVRMREKAH